jgi:hypothetical protein
MAMKLLIPMFLLFVLPACADTYLESRGMMGMVQKTWTTTDRRREEAAADPKSPMFEVAKMTGQDQTIRIISIDKGVQWTLHPKLTAYVEEPLAIPYQKPSETKPADTPSFTPEEDAKAPEPVEKVEFKKAPATRTIAGFECEGTEIWVDGKKQMIWWSAPPKGDIKTFMEQDERFRRKLHNAQYADWPDAARQEQVLGLEMLGALMVKGDRFGSLFKGASKLPEGYPMSWEISDPDAAGMGSLLEVQKLTLEKAPASLFEVPPGYKKLTQAEFEEAKRKKMLETMTGEKAPAGMDPKTLQMLEKQMKQFAPPSSGDTPPSEATGRVLP